MARRSLADRITDEIRQQVPSMPRINLPAGIAGAQVLDCDRELADQVHLWSWQMCLLQARDHLRRSRKLRRRAAGRGFAQLAKMRRERGMAARHLMTAASLCGIAELLRVGLRVTAERCAWMREGCQPQIIADPARFTGVVDEWIRELHDRPDEQGPPTVFG